MREEHLDLGSKAINNKQARDRGRHVAGKSFGDKNGRAKISDAKRQELVAEKAANPALTQKELARKYGLSRSRVGEILRETREE